jgi:parallel beta-helix repeat protein
VSGVTIARNACSGVINFNGSMSIDDSDFSEPVFSDLNASIVGYEADSTHVTNSRFVEGSSLTEYRREEYDFGGGTGTGIYTYIYTGHVGNDIRFFGGGDNLVDGNTFSDGAEGVFVYESDATVQNNTWTNYSRYAAYFSNGADSSTYQNNVYENSSGHAILCDGSTVAISNLEVDRTMSTSFGGYEILIDGVSSGTYSDPITAYPASHFTDCTSSIDNTSYADTVATAVYATGGTISLDTVSITRASAEPMFGSAAVNLDGSVNPVSATIDNLTVTDQGYGSAISIGGSITDGGYTASLVASDILVNGGRGDAIELSYTDSQIDEVSLSGMEGSGLYITGGTVTVDGGVISGAGSDGVYAAVAELALTDLFILNSDSHGVLVESGTLSATDNSIKENTGNGVTLTNTESTTLANNSITDNESHGLHCGGSTFLVCENDISGNALGPTDDCGIACGFEGPDTDVDADADIDADGTVEDADADGTVEDADDDADGTVEDADDDADGAVEDADDDADGAFDVDGAFEDADGTVDDADGAVDDADGAVDDADGAVDDADDDADGAFEDADDDADGAFDDADIDVDGAFDDADDDADGAFDDVGTDVDGSFDDDDTDVDGSFDDADTDVDGSFDDDDTDGTD